MKIRELKTSETELLKDFLYEAIFIPEGVEPPDRSIIELPELRLYYEDFGKGKADLCLVCEEDGRVVGAVWTRIMNDYGHVDDDTPSFAISLYKEYRGRGVGTKLMYAMLELLRSKGYKRASLAVQKANYAVRMYEKVGFRITDQNDEEYIMVYDDNRSGGRFYDLVKKIPSGQVATYGQIAELAGNRKLARVVGNLLHRNPDPDNIPCYRVVNAKGELAENFAFGGAGAQKKLLEAEGVVVEDGRVNLKLFQWKPTVPLIEKEKNHGILGSL